MLALRIKRALTTSGMPIGRTPSSKQRDRDGYHISFDRTLSFRHFAPCPSPRMAALVLLNRLLLMVVRRMRMRLAVCWVRR